MSVFDFRANPALVHERAAAAWVFLCFGVCCVDVIMQIVTLCLITMG